MMMRRQSKQRLTLLAVGMVVVYIMWSYLRNDSVDWEFMDGDLEGGGGGPPVGPKGVQHEKWIVVTTIQSPTHAMRQTVGIPGWQLLVVGDTKTPQDWKLEGAIFLDVRRQKALGYRTTQLLPYASYTRKAVGYLYAIEHGAVYIYDTDDDNYPHYLQVFHSSEFHGQFLVVDTGNMTYNPYPHFGQSSLWPRGYPLELLGTTASHSYKLCPTNRPVIQQGLVSGDPDVDAIFRMTRTQNGQPIKLSFDFAAPSIMLPHGTFAPMNSQNTLFTGKAFWSLMLPTTVAQRACDIYRSYWAQTLLWLSGDSVAFYPPTAEQKRNPHSNKIDFRGETEIYKYMEDLLKYLLQWKCRKVFFFDCMTQLAHDMVDAGYWKSDDAVLVEAWVADLANLGYVPPAVQKSSICHSKDPPPVIFYPVEQNTTFPHTGYQSVAPPYQSMAQAFVKDVCPEVVTKEQHKGVQSDTLLIVQVRDSSYIPAMESLYRRFYPNILYCGSHPLKQDVRRVITSWGVSYVHPPEGPGVVPCLNTAMDMNYNVNAYLYITDNMLLLADQLSSKHANLMWMTGDLHVYNPDKIDRCQVDLRCQAVSKQNIIQLNQRVRDMKVEERTKTDLQHCFKKLAVDPSKQEEIVHLTDLAVHIPSRVTPVFQEVARPYLKSDMRDFSFMTILLMECLEIAPDYLVFLDPADPLDTKTDYEYLYPFNIQQVGASGSTQNAKFCQVLH